MSNKGATTLGCTTVDDIINYLHGKIKNYTIEIEQDHFPSLYFSSNGKRTADNAALMSTIVSYEFDIDNPDKNLKLRVRI